MRNNGLTSPDCSGLALERHTHRKRRHVQPPLTPMIDVTFLLLVFFLLTFTFREAEGQIRGALPATDPGRPSWASIDLHVRPAGPAGQDGVFELVGDAGVITDPTELYSRLAARRVVLSDESAVTIRPVWSVRWQHVVEAFNQAVRADFQNVNIAPSRTE